MLESSDFASYFCVVRRSIDLLKMVGETLALPATVTISLVPSCLVLHCHILDDYGEGLYAGDGSMSLIFRTTASRIAETNHGISLTC